MTIIPAALGDFVIGIGDDGTTISLDDNPVTEWAIDASGVLPPVPVIVGTLPPRWAHCTAWPRRTRWRRSPKS
jgi:hypothetical protein